MAVPLIFFAVWLTCWGCSSFLLAAGMTSIPARYAIGCGVSYGVFVLLVGAWCRLVTARHTSDRNSDSLLDGVDGTPFVDDEGCLIGLGVFLLGALVSGLVWWLGGYALMFEVAFEFAFAGTVVSRWGRHPVEGNWAGTLVRRTWIPALIVSGVLVATAAKLQHDHPKAVTILQALKARS